MFCIADDPISSRTKPSSRVLHPIEDVYFHQFHLKGKQDYGHQAVAVLRPAWTFIGTDDSLSIREILDIYVERWTMEVFFCQSKDKLAFDRCQVRSSQGIRRYWLLMLLAHLLACTGCGEAMSFEDDYAYIYSHIQEEQICFVYQCEARNIGFE